MEPTLADLDKQIAVLQERLRASEIALSSQAREYERRLTELNHAHQQQQDRNAQYVSREAWELNNKEGEARLNVIERQQSRAYGIGAGFALAASILTAFVMWVIK